MLASPPKMCRILQKSNMKPILWKEFSEIYNLCPKYWILPLMTFYSWGCNTTGVGVLHVTLHYSFVKHLAVLLGQYTKCYLITIHFSIWPVATTNSLPVLQRNISNSFHYIRLSFLWLYHLYNMMIDQQSTINMHCKSHKQNCACVN